MKNKYLKSGATGQLSKLVGQIKNEEVFCKVNKKDVK